MAVTNKSFGVNLLSLSDGTRIILLINKNGPRPIYKAKVISAARKDDPFTFTMKSGLFEGRSDYDAMLAQGFFDDVILVQSDGYTYTRTDWQPDVELIESLGIRLLGYYDISETEQRLYQACVAVADTVWHPPFTQYSGMFTGEMRKVAQILFGMGVGVPYAYCYSKTHGIYKAANGSRWVIEISTQDGITAWPLQNRPAHNPLQQGNTLSYLPIPSVNLPWMADRVILAEPSALSGYAAKDSLAISGDVGWAFSDNGSQAINVGFGLDGAHYISTLFTISISGSGSGPTSATVAEGESGYYYNNYQPWCHVKYTRYAGGSGASLVSRYMEYGSAPPVWGRAPAYAFYKGETPVIAYFRRQENPVGVSRDGFPGNLPSEPSDLGAYISGQERYVNGVGWFEIEGMERQEPEPEVWKSSYYDKKTFSASSEPGGWVPANASPAGGGIGIQQDVWKITVTTDSYWPYSGGWIQREVLVVPAHERAGFYLYSTSSGTDGNDLIKRYHTYEQFRTSNGAIYENGGASRTYSESLDGANPCNCGADGTVVGRNMGKAYTNITSYNAYSVYTKGALGFYKSPISDPRLTDYWLACYNDENGTPDPPPANPCIHKLPILPEMETSLVTHVGPKPAYRKLWFYHADLDPIKVREDEDYSPYDALAVWLEIGDGMWLDATLDAFTGAGSIGVNPISPNLDRKIIQNADRYYPIDELNTRYHGWFGCPFPELTS